MKSKPWQEADPRCTSVFTHRRALGREPDTRDPRREKVTCAHTKKKNKNKNKKNKNKKKNKKNKKNKNKKNKNKNKK
ncbi:hypothetical protein EYF80_060962 [Liparis tanakae]|uniref:Uncharacterized protein n=1 Tax=Liparis tanakae TaxID=230148 RepID=A0A4Z2EJX7_9TELE|nr:hypothetical protein EYF80_060962 [Liparis tanakae]